MTRFLAALLGLVPLATFAGPASGPPSEDAIRATIKSLAPDAKIEVISPSPIAGLYEVVIDNGMFYLPADGKYFINGDLWQVDGKKNLTDVRRAGLRKVALHEFGDDKRIVYPATGEAKHKVTVFTDIDCGYCRRLHQQMADYNKAGITVEYMFFPRSGLNTDSYNKAVSVWCAADRNAALTKSKAGSDLESKTCANPIAEEFELGRKLGVAGTPAIFAEDGSQIGGYLTPEQMSQKLDSIKP